MSEISWDRVTDIDPQSFVCGYCSKYVSSDKGFEGTYREGIVYIYICHHCGQPTYIDDYGNQAPNSMYGNDVLDISDKLVSELYDEARKVMSVGGHTAAVLCCRKLLMHIAVDKGADKGKKFIEYVEYLSNQNYVPPDAKDWVDQIRKSGNEATHEIIIKEREEAEDIISFVEMILRLVYEFPAKVKRKNKPAETT